MTDCCQRNFRFFLNEKMNNLFRKLEFLSNDSSIDIKRISFKGVTKDSSQIDLKIQSNGIVIVNEGAAEYAKAIIKPIVERGIFG